MEKTTSTPSPSQLGLRLLKQLMEKFPFLHPKYRHIIHEYRFTWVKWHSAASRFYAAMGRLTQDEWLGVAQPVRGKLFLITVTRVFCKCSSKLRHEIPLKLLWRWFGSFTSQKTDGSTYLFLPFDGEQQVVPADFQGCLAETDEYFLQNRGPQHCSIYINNAAGC